MPQQPSRALGFGSVPFAGVCGLLRHQGYMCVRDACFTAPIPHPIAMGSLEAGRSLVSLQVKRRPERARRAWRNSSERQNPRGPPSFPPKNNILHNRRGRRHMKDDLLFQLEMSPIRFIWVTKYFFKKQTRAATRVERTHFRVRQTRAPL